MASRVERAPGREYPPFHEHPAWKRAVAEQDAREARLAFRRINRRSPTFRAGLRAMKRMLKRVEALPPTKEQKIVARGQQEIARLCRKARLNPSVWLEDAITVSIIGTRRGAEKFKRGDLAPVRGAFRRVTRDLRPRAGAARPASAP